jgi:hypothetical protein
MFVVFEPRCQEACGSSCYSAPEATITLSSLSLSTRYNVDHPTPNAFATSRSGLPLSSRPRAIST